MAHISVAEADTYVTEDLTAYHTKTERKFAMYQRKKRGWSQHLDFMALDILTLELSLIISFLLRVGLNAMLKEGMFWSLFIFLPFVDLAVMVTSDTYHEVIRRDTYHEFTKLVNQATYLTLIFGAFLILTQSDIHYTRYVFFVTMLLYLLLCFCVRSGWKSRLRHRLHIRNRSRLLVVAELQRLHEVVTNLISHNYNSYRFAGIALLDEGVPIQEGEKAIQNIMTGSQKVTDLQVVASREDLSDYLVKNWVDEVYLDARDGTDMPTDLINQIMSMGITVHLAINNIDRIVARHKDIEWICGQATITASLGYVSGRDLFLKRLMDVAGGIVGCLITVLLALILGPLIYVASPGPIFFHQTRIGENGRKFEMYKFRSKIGRAHV